MEQNTVKEIFIELNERFESTENLQALVTLLNYFEDFDFGFDEKDQSEIISSITDSINILS